MDCPVCLKTFSRPDAMKRHLKHVHKSTEQKSPNLMSGDGILPDSSLPNLLLQHPFTMLVAGPTGSGKTMWVKNLLENVETMISPSPQRIIWCYGQWQPLYDAMQQSVHPQIEFVEGLPPDLESEDYLDVNVRNLIIIDDLMSEAAKDSRLCNLFTKGSHHRNLSVMCLVQNIFHHGKEMRNISLNTHYLVLFKTPRDKQQINILARQMFPTHTSYMMDQFERATQRPYGYLLVDLKPNTPEQQRLRTNVLPGEKPVGVKIGGQHIDRSVAPSTEIEENQPMAPSTEIEEKQPTLSSDKIAEKSQNPTWDSMKDKNIINWLYSDGSEPTGWKDYLHHEVANEHTLDRGNMTDKALAHLCALEWNGHYPRNVTCTTCNGPQVSFLLAHCSWCKHAYLTLIPEDKVWSKLCPKCDEINTHSMSLSKRGYVYCQKCKEVGIFKANKKKKLEQVSSMSVDC